MRPQAGGEDREILAIVDTYRKQMDAVLNARIGEAEVDLEGEQVRLKETNLGNFVADILRQTAKSDIALIMSAGAEAKLSLISRA